MKRSATILIVVLAAVAMGLIFLLADGQAQMGGGGMMGPGYGYGMGPGMMYGGYGYRQLEKPLQKKDAEQMFNNYVQSLYNPDLKVGKITEKDTYFEGEILAKDNKLVDTIFVDKNTGWMSTAMRGRGGGYGYGMGPGMMGPGYGYGMGPGMMGPGYGYGMGPGMMGPGYGYGYGMGPGMMGPGYGYGYGMGPGMMGQGYGYGPQYQQLEKPLGKKDAQEILENYVKSLYNPNLKVGKITEKDTYFEGEILTKDNVLVDKIIIDKNTGWMSSAMTGPGYQGYGPQYRRSQGPLQEKDVKAMLEQYVQSTRNPNLKVGKITEKDTYFEGEILTKNNALVDKILVDKNTGWMRSEYQ
jgi:hypothetical protein